MPRFGVPEGVAKSVTFRDVVVERRDADGRILRILDIPQFEIGAGQIVCVTGPSGAGKSTLLEVVGGLTRLQQGSLLWDGADIARLSERDRDVWRRDTVGFIFQDFHLIPELSVRENILAPARFAHFRVPPRLSSRADSLLLALGLPSPSRRAASLSRGEQQRVAVARALLMRPQLILADEPTASLDAATGAEVLGLLLRQAKEIGATLVLVSHDPMVINAAGRSIVMKAGRIVVKP